MKKWLVLGVAGLLSACGGVGGVNMPRVISGDSDGFVVGGGSEGLNWNSSASGGLNPKKAQDVADYYCSQLGKKAEFVSRGGPTSECVSKQLNVCMTYRCE
ncbi:hypothetical protein [Telmatospirillum siberiense]|nr:hypothetical protein [Telmatospirillum siberiense]